MSFTTNIQHEVESGLSSPKFNMFDFIQLKYNIFFKYLYSRPVNLLHDPITQYEIAMNFMAINETLMGS